MGALALSCVIALPLFVIHLSFECDRLRSFPRRRGWLARQRPADGRWGRPTVGRSEVRGLLEQATDAPSCCNTTWTHKGSAAQRADAA